MAELSEKVVKEVSGQESGERSIETNTSHEFTQSSVQTNPNQAQHIVGTQAQPIQTSDQTQNFISFHKHDENIVLQSENIQLGEPRRWSQSKLPSSSVQERPLNSSYRNSAISVNPVPYPYKYHSISKLEDNLLGEDDDINFNEAFYPTKNSNFQANASTMARPITDYRPLQLFTKKKVTNRKDAETQVDPMDIERTGALMRGIFLNPSNVLWPTNGAFSIMSAEKRIEDYVQRCWKMCPSWFFHVEFLQAVDGCYRNKYIFEVKWSMPTAENPIPIATASVYFVFDVETYSGRDETVKVHYIIEGSRYAHVPTEIAFQQKWISGIICEKMRLRKCL